MRLVSTAVLLVGLTVPLTALPAAKAAAPPRCDGLRATIVGNAKGSSIKGTPQRDVIVAGAGNDRIRGLGGNDVICGGEGADTIHGGPGNDRLFGETDRYWTDTFGRVRRKGDMLVPGAGDDLVDPGADVRAVTPGVAVVPDGVSYASAPQPAVVSLADAVANLGADGADQIITNPAGLRFVGTNLNDVITGTDGDDTVSGLGGDDSISGRDGDDRIRMDHAGQVGNDRGSGGSGHDHITGSVGSDTFVGSSGEDTLTSGSTLPQVFRGGGGADTVAFPLPTMSGFAAKGYGGNDRLRLLAYPNPTFKPTLRVDQRKSRATIRGLVPTTVAGKIQGFSRISLPGHTKSIFKGSNASEIINAHPEHRAMIYGRGGADVITGSRQPDRLEGGRGFDIVRAMGGNDTCRTAERRWSC